MVPGAEAAVAPGAESVLAGLDPDQIEAVTTPSTLVAVIAGAGSGKTRVLTSRIAYRLANGTADAAHTLALTFTREAAGELRRRVRRTGVREHVEAGTFHSVALGLLRQRRFDQGRPPPVVADDRNRLLAIVADGIPVSALAAEVEWAAAQGVGVDEYVGAARRAGRRSVGSADRVAETLVRYEQLKRRRGVVDLDDLLTVAVSEMLADDAWADALRWRFRHVLVDEAQDLNPVQYRLLELLIGTRRDLYLVGDPAQAIYGFNGSDPTLLADIADRLPGVELVRLPTNHRCTPQIVAAGAHVLRAADASSTATASRPDGAVVRVVAADDEDHEAALVAAFVRSLDPGLARGSAGVAVLARTNQQLRRLDDALVAAGVAVRRRPLADGSPLGRAVRTVTTLPSASRLREWAHDTIDDEDEPADSADRQLATVVLQFLRDQPTGDGASLRAWLAIANPFADSSAGVELLTFHGAKGREWPVVVVTGVETGLVPYRLATSNAARAEEARLLHVALTRASEHLVVMWSRRRGGYARKLSPLIDGLDVEPPAPAPVPPELRSAQAPPRDRRLDELHAWRARAARAADVLPAEMCTDSELTAIAAASPASPEELAAITGFGMLTASRLFDAIRSALDQAEH